MALILQDNIVLLSRGIDFLELEVQDAMGNFLVTFAPSPSCNCSEPQPCPHIQAAMTWKDTQKKEVITSKEGKAYTRQGMIRRVLAERKKRADSEKYVLKKASNSHGEHKLITAGGKTYKLTLRTKDNGYCDCSDYATNKLGTCKHLMFAKKHLSVSDDAFPFLEIYLDPLNHYQITWFGPETLPLEQQKLIRLYFGNQKFIPEKQTLMFFGFIKEAKKFKNILIRPDVLEKIESEFEKQLLFQKEADTQLDFSLIKADLFEYQKEGIQFATFRKGAILADEMGLGKTIQAIGAAIYKKQLLGFKNCLIVCPASLKMQWKAEIEKFTSETVFLPADGKFQLKDIPSYFILLTYETIVKDISYLKDQGFDLIILDEAQRIRNFETQTSNAIKALQKNHALVLTGTPIENKLVDLYSITAFIDLKLLSPLWEFSYQHCYFDVENENKITGYYNLNRLKEKLQPILLRRERADVMTQLNKRTIIDIPVEMHPVQREMHAQLAQKVSMIVSKKLKTPYDWQMLTQYLQKMRMLCDGVFLLDQEQDISPKLKELEEILLEKLDLKVQKVLIFSEWLAVLDKIAIILQRNEIDFAVLTGNVPVKSRQKLVDQFNTDQRCRVFLCTETAGSGLNLQSADTVINFELPWNPAKKNQRIGRIDRIGQKNSKLTIINLIMRDSIETKLIQGLKLKQDLFDSILETGNESDDVDLTEKAQFLQELEHAFAEQEHPKDEIQEILQKGIDFLSGIYKISTGKELHPEGCRLEKDIHTGEWVIRFKID